MRSRPAKDVINSLGGKTEVGSADKRFRDPVWNFQPRLQAADGFVSRLVWVGDEVGGQP